MTAEPGKTYQYDAEGRLKSLNNGCPSTLCYTYDGNGRRVRKIASGVTTEYIYGAGGVVAEKVGTTWTVGYVYLNGQLLAQYKSQIPGGSAENGTTYFAHKDHLGSTRLLTKPDGSYDSADVYDYLPYGEPAGSTSTTTSHKFTGHERDAESGLDFMQARYYASIAGRFLSVDTGPLNGSDPQNLNRYPYVQNNPLKFVDPTGQVLVLTGADADALFEQLKKESGLDMEMGDDGTITIKKKSKRNTEGTSKELADLLKQIIGDKKTTVSVTAEKDAALVLVDSFATRTADPNDIAAMQSMGPPGLAASALGHFLKEYYHAAKELGDARTREAFGVAHQEALKTESKILAKYTRQKEQRGPDALDRGRGIVTVTFSSLVVDIWVKVSASDSWDISSIDTQKRPKRR